MKNKKKYSGDKIFKSTANWDFSGNVSKNFDDHIEKSVPLYKETHQIYLLLSDFFLQDKSNVVDLGCSNGTFLIDVFKRHKLNKKKINYIGLDNTKEMINTCKKRSKIIKNLKFFIKDINKFEYKNCCIISSFYTVQFISPKYRQALINKIYKSLNWGGAFFFVEKVRAGDARFQDIFNQVYLEYKITKGFTADEIINKSKSLKGVLEPFSTSGNKDLLKRAGFKDIHTVFKYSSFQGFLAIK